VLGGMEVNGYGNELMEDIPWGVLWFGVLCCRNRSGNDWNGY
jgi:hypothetical protein